MTIPFAILLTGLSVNAVWLLWSKRRDRRLARVLGIHPTELLMRSRRFPAGE